MFLSNNYCLEPPSYEMVCYAVTESWKYIEGKESRSWILNMDKGPSVRSFTITFTQLLSRKRTFSNNLPWLSKYIPFSLDKLMASQAWALSHSRLKATQRSTIVASLPVCLTDENQRGEVTCPRPAGCIQQNLGWTPTLLTPSLASFYCIVLLVYNDV